MKHNNIYTEVDILVGFQNHDPKIFEYLYKYYWKQLVYFNKQIVKDVEVSEDLSSQALIKLFSLDKNFDTLIQLRSYLYNISRNLCRDHLRIQKLHKKYQSIGREMDYSEEIDFEFQWIKAEIFRIINDAIEQLPEECYKTFMAYFSKGFNFGDGLEVSNKLKVAGSTARRQKSIAINHIRQALKLNGYL